MKQGGRILKKSSQIIALIIGTALILCACSESEQPDSQEVLNNTQDEISADAQTLLDLEKYSLQPREDSDDTPGFQWKEIAGSEQGYYYWNGLNTLMYYDISSGLSMPLCNRPDCSHAGKDCNAYFDVVLEDADNTFSDSWLQFVDGYLYIIGVDAKDYVSLYKISADGSTREKCMRLYRADFSSPSGNSSDMEFSSPEVCIHRGYAYWIDRKAAPLCIRRMKLGGKKDEIVYTEGGESANTYRLEGYGDFLFFQSGHFIDEGYHMEGGIYTYNIQNGEIQLVLDGAISAYMLEGNQIFYVTETGISVYDLTTGKSEPRVENGIVYQDMSVDERYLYSYDDETDKLTVYKHDGTVVAKIMEEGVSLCTFGDSRYLFASKTPEVDDDNISGVAILSVDDIESGNAKWTNLK